MRLPEPESGEWFDRPDPTGLTETGERGLRFSCTMCGACCTGPSGFVLFTDDEADAMAAAMGVSRDEFLTRYTRETVLGRSLAEKPSPFGQDCVFLDRDRVPGRAVCGLYEARPEQCRTWPFWKSNLRTRRNWEQAAARCPGMNKGPLTDPETVRLTRDRLDI
ncbi:MAG: YkgJ family cysteine cluster protein [Planctomycetota bacterium]|nr:MAG: YkgJ family cysteine cluster protein [Planctomycetota bacterium]